MKILEHLHNCFVKCVPAKAELTVTQHNAKALNTSS